MYAYEDRAKKIGERIKKERKALGLTAPNFLLQLQMSESSTKSLTNWEQGKYLPDLDTLAKMAELFNCDIGYLLGDYDEKRRTTADIRKQTGLSEDAILALQNMNPKKIATTVLSSILIQPDIDQWFFQIYRIAGESSVCKNLRKASITERCAMENKRITTQAELALSRAAVPELENAELQEFKRHNKMLEGVISDLCHTDSDIIDYGIGGAERAIQEYRENID